MSAVDPLAWLDELDQAHVRGTADGEWRPQDNGTRHGPECRYEILDDEGSVAVCSDDNDATDTTGADRTALIVAAVNAQPKLTAALRAVLDLADDWDRNAAIFPEYGDLSAAAARSIRTAITTALTPEPDQP